MARKEVVETDEVKQTCVQILAVPLRSWWDQDQFLKLSVPQCPQKNKKIKKGGGRIKIVPAL